jgi:pyruvate-ferredoxin/flavodoxin oxidoreductase
VCGDDALETVPQSAESVARLRQDWSLWMDLPTTPARYSRVQDLEQGIGALETLLLDKEPYLAFSSGDGACLGCGEKTTLRLFVATAEALMRPRVEAHVDYLADLVQRLEHHVQSRLAEEIDVDAPERIARAMDQEHGDDLTLSALAGRLETIAGTRPIDRDWLARVIDLVRSLKDLHRRYTHGATGRGRANMGILNATGCSSVWGSTWPFNPYPFPWANHLFQDSASMAMGVFEGHMQKMARGFKAIRMAELELAGGYEPAEHDPFFQRFSWHDFDDRELALCPPVVTVGGDGAMYDIGFQNLSRALMSGKPIKVVVLDTQVYSNTGGQACTSGFTGQISDMAPFGPAMAGKQEVRKELAWIAIAHRTAYVMQSTMAHASHMIEGFVQGLTSRRPAVFNLFTPCQPEHGIGDDMAHAQAKLAVESRAYPLLRFDPDRGTTLADCLDLGGNPARREDWPSYKLQYREGERDRTLALPMTFADYAATEVRFRKHFRTAPPDTWDDNMAPLAEFLEMDLAGREGKRPYIDTVDARGELGRLLVDETMVRSCEDRRAFWRLLQGLEPARPAVGDPAAFELELRQQVAAELVAGLMRLAGGDSAAQGGTRATINTISGNTISGDAQPAPAEPAGVTVPDGATAYMAPWIDSEECTACDECTRLNPDMFAYRADRKAAIQDPNAGPYEDLVRAAERCNAGVIHPGLPRDANAPGMDAWIKRAEPFN